MMLYFDSGAIAPLKRPFGLGDFGWSGAYVPLVPTNYKHATRLRVRVGGRDYALYGIVVPDLRNVITHCALTDNGIEFRRYNGELAGVIPIGGGGYADG